eukprot:4493809-Prymnesium_polylepis.1
MRAVRYGPLDGTSCPPLNQDSTITVQVPEALLSRSVLDAPHSAITPFDRIRRDRNFVSVQLFPAPVPPRHTRLAARLGGSDLRKSV